MAVTFEDRKASVTIARLWDGTGADPGGAQVTVNHPGMSVATIQVVGTLSLTLVPEGTSDEATLVALNAVNLNTGVKAQTITAAGLYRVDVAGLRVLRVRCSAYTSGTPVVTVNASFASTDASSTSSGTGTSSTQVQGTAASGAALSGNPVRQGMSDGTLVQDIISANGATGAAGAVAGVPGAALMGWHSPTYTRVDSAALIGVDGWISTHELLMVASMGGVYNGASADRMRAANTAAGTTGTGLQGVGPLVWDGTNWNRASQPSLVAGTTGTGLLAAGLMGFDGTNWQSLKVDAAQQLRFNLRSSGGVEVGFLNSGVDNLGNGNGSIITTANGSDFDGTTWNRHRNNNDVIIQASTATVASTINTDIVTYNAGKLLVHINVSLFNGGTLTVKLQWKDANGLFMDIPLATTGALASGGPDFLMCLGPNTWPANTATAFYANLTVPRLVRIVQTIATATVTYSAAYSTNCN